MRLRYYLRYNTAFCETYQDLASGRQLQVSAEIRTGWLRLAPDQQQALDTICDKIARILNGDPNYTDNWHDIQGYAKLVEDRLLAEEYERSREEAK